MNDNASNADRDAQAVKESDARRYAAGFRAMVAITMRGVPSVSWQSISRFCACRVASRNAFQYRRGAGGNADNGRRLWRRSNATWARTTLISASIASSTDRPCTAMSCSSARAVQYRLDSGNTSTRISVTGTIRRGVSAKSTMDNRQQTLSAGEFHVPEFAQMFVI